MKVSLEECVVARKDIPMRELIARLQETLARNHQKILDAARTEWERRSTLGQDPSDACVTVRVSMPARPSRKPRARKPHATKRHSTVNGSATRNHRRGG